MHCGHSGAGPNVCRREGTVTRLLKWLRARLWLRRLARINRAEAR